MKIKDESYHVGLGDMQPMIAIQNSICRVKECQCHIFNISVIITIKAILITLCPEQAPLIQGP